VAGRCINLKIFTFCEETPMTWRYFMMTTVLLATLAPLFGADEAKQQENDKQVVDTNATKKAPAKSVDFRKELGVPFNSLHTLGARIDVARQTHDPVSLGHAANELAVAEKVGGKKATLTSTTVMQEANELAKLRRQVPELEAMVHLNQQIASQEELIADLKRQIDLSKKIAKDESDSVQRNEEPTGPRKLLVNNYTPQYVDVWVNGTLKLQLQPGQSKWCVIEHKWNPTVMTASGNEDLTNWGPRYVWGNFQTYTWNLH
jgi:hypothetical protein